MTQSLNQEEIDSLLSNPLDNEDSSTIGSSPIPKIFDLSNNNKSIYGRIATLGLINERFGRNMKATLNTFLKRNVEIIMLGLKVLKFEEYITSLHIPSSINMVKMPPLKGLALFVADSKLVFTVVENFFGGEGKVQSKNELRDFTSTENRIVKMMIELFFKDLKEAWSSVLDIQFEYKALEVNPAMANVLNLSELIIISKFRIELDGGGGDFHICLPYSMIEPIRELLNAGIRQEKEVSDEKWIQRIREEIMEAEVQACCILTQKKVSLKDVLRFKNGDIIDIEIPEEITLKVNDIPMFTASFGTFEGKYAIKIVDKLKKATKR